MALATTPRDWGDPRYVHGQHGKSSSVIQYGLLLLGFFLRLRHTHPRQLTRYGVEDHCHRPILHTRSRLIGLN